MPMKLLQKKASPAEKVNKCPKCGAVLDSISGICPDCSYEASGLKVNSVVEDFTKKIYQAESPLSRTTVAHAIVNFPVPSGRQDLLEFLSFLCPKIYPVTVGNRKKNLKAVEIAQAYFLKFEESIKKANILYPNDPVFVSYLEEYDNYQPAKPKKSLFDQVVKLVLKIILFLIIAFVALLVLGIFGLFSIL